MSITRWDPFSDVMPLRDLMGQLMEESFIMPRSFRQREASFSFPVDIFETDSDMVIKASLPGFRPEEIDVRVADNVITIKGEHLEQREEPGPQQTSQQGRRQEEGSRVNYYRREISGGSIYREIVLPTEVQTDKARATFEHGVLTLELPKAEQAKARRIAVHPATAKEGQPRIQQGQSQTGQQPLQRER